MTNAPPPDPVPSVAGLPAQIDPKGLIRAAYEIPGIGDAECRAILIDWALSLDLATDAVEALNRLAAHHAPHAPEHPMTMLLQQRRIPAKTTAARRRRRRGQSG